MTTENQTTEQATTTDTTVSQETTETSKETEATKTTENKQDDVEANKTEALKQEREKRKAIEAKLAEYEKKEAEAIEKEKLKKGKFEEVIGEKEAKIAEMQKIIEELTPIKNKFEESMHKTLEDLKGKIPEGKKEFVEKVIAGKSYDEQVEILGEFSKEFTAYSANAKSSNHQVSGSVYADAKAKGSIASMIANAPEVRN